jgi:hypothetical protein
LPSTVRTFPATRYCLTLATRVLLRVLDATPRARGPRTHPSFKRAPRRRLV